MNEDLPYNFGMQENSEEDPEPEAEKDELESQGSNDSEDASPTQIIKDTVQECPGAFIKFRVQNPTILAKENKKKAVAAKRRQTAANKRNAKTKASTKRKVAADDNENEPVAKKSKKTENNGSEGTISIGSSDEEDQVEKKGKGKGKAKNVEPETDITAYLYVERPISTAPIRAGSSSRAHKPTDEEKYVTRGLVMFTPSTPYVAFLLRISQQLPCAVEDIIQEKITWKFQTPIKSTYLSLSGEVGFASMISQLMGRKVGARVIMLAMPPPRKPMIEKPPWDADDKKDFDFSELDVISTSDHVVEQRATFDKSVGPHKEALMEKYPENNNALFPNKRIYTDSKMNANYDLTDLKLSVWAFHIARGTATLEKPPISSHFDYKARILPPTTPALPPAALPATVSAPAPVSIPGASLTPTGGSSLMDIILINMIQQQQQQLQTFNLFRHPLASDASSSAPAPAPAPVPAPAPAIVPAPAAPSIPSAPQSPAYLPKIPDISLAAFCQCYNINATDQERLEKLEFQPGDKIDGLSEDDWKVFAGFTSLSWRRIVDKNHSFIRDVCNGLWA